MFDVYGLKSFIAKYDYLPEMIPKSSGAFEDTFMQWIDRSVLTNWLRGDVRALGLENTTNTGNHRRVGIK